MLKTRFDEIFAATKYIKALDVLKKIRLEKTHIINTVKVEKKHLENYKNTSEKLNSDLQSGLVRKENFLEHKADIEEKIKPIQSQIDKFLLESAQIFQIKNEMEKIHNEKDLLGKQIKELITITKNCRFEGSIDELKQHIHEFETTTIHMLGEEEEALKDKQDDFYLKLKELNDKRTKLKLEIGQIETKTKIFMSKKSDLAELAKRACKLIKMNPNELFKEPGDSDFEQSLLEEKFKEFVGQSEASLRSLEKTAKSEEESLQNEINEQRDEKSKLDQNIVIKEENTFKARQELEKLDSELQQVADDKVLVQLNGKIETLETELADESVNLIDSERVKREIDEYERKQTSLKLLESETDAKINKLHANSQSKTELDLLVKVCQLMF